MFLNIDKRDPVSEAIVDGDGLRITYGDLLSFTELFAQKVASRELIFVITENCGGACAGYVAALSNGIVPLMLSHTLNKELLSDLMQTYHPAYLWAPADYEMEQDYPTEFTYWGYKLMNTGFTSPAMAPELALLLPTSGSTGSPKLVRHKLENVEASARAVSSAFAFNENSRGMVSLPLNFTQGLNVATSHLYVGGTALMTKATITMREFWNFFKAEHAESFTGVPYSYEVLDKLRFFRMDLPDLKIINQGGGRMPDTLFTKCTTYATDTGRKFIATYGSTETTSRMAYLPAEVAAEKIGSIGKALPGYRIELKDADGNLITNANEDGEIVFYGANVTLGYAESAADLTKGDERCGVYATGDLAHYDEDGYLYVVGRKARFLKLFGYRVSLDSMERRIKASLGIACACTGTDKRMTVFVEREDVADDVMKILMETTNLHKQAFAVQFIENIPKNDSGKILYSALNKLL